MSAKETRTETPQVFHGTVAVNFMMEAESPLVAANLLSHMNLSDIGHEIDDGDFLGQMKIVSLRQVDPRTLDYRQKALGNDGSFFETEGAQIKDDAESKILKCQIEAGWTSSTLQQVMSNFLRENGLMAAFAGYAEDLMEEELAMGPEADIEP